MVKKEDLAKLILGHIVDCVSVRQHDLVIKATINSRIPVDSMPISVSRVHPQAWDLTEAIEELFLQRWAVTKNQEPVCMFHDVLFVSVRLTD